MITNQAFLFLIFSLNGVIIGLIFDFFRILRKCFKTSDLITYIQDIIFWILTGISIIFFMYNFSDGTIRLFILIGLFLGFLIYILTISKYIINILVIFISFLKKTILTILNIVRVPINIVINSFNKSILVLSNNLLSKIDYFFTKYINKNKLNYKNVKKNTI